MASQAILLLSMSHFNPLSTSNLANNCHRSRLLDPFECNSKSSSVINNQRKFSEPSSCHTASVIWLIVALCFSANFSLGSTMPSRGDGPPSICVVMTNMELLSNFACDTPGSSSTRNSKPRGTPGGTSRPFLHSGVSISGVPRGRFPPCRGSASGNDVASTISLA